MTIIGPFKQLLTMDKLPLKGAVRDEQLRIITEAGVLIKKDCIVEVGTFNDLRTKYQNAKRIRLERDYVCTPGLVDAHTHICFGGSRARDYAMRVAGVSYQEIAKAGGGIKDSVKATRETPLEELTRLTAERAQIHLKRGVTTCEVKSGYGLTVKDELKMLEAIQAANQQTNSDLIPTCLAAHVCPPEFASGLEYTKFITNNLFPILKEKNLTNRVDIFIEENAFDTEAATYYLKKSKESGFDITVHADQFTTGGSILAAEYGAVSADHLEVSTEKEIQLLAESNVIGTVLPGAAIGLGIGYPLARKMLDNGMCLAIASDWNPGSAPMGDLLLQAALIGAAEKLSMAETWSAITFRAAAALKLKDRGVIRNGAKADLICYPTSDFRDILYHQGMLKPEIIIKNGGIVS